MNIVLPGLSAVGKPILMELPRATLRAMSDQSTPQGAPDQPPPLPNLRAPGEWRQVPIEPSDEPLVRVRDIGPRVFDDPQYHALGLPGSRAVAVIREGVAERLARVAAALPDGLSLVIWDGWRSYETQQALYEGWMADLARKHTNWPIDVLHRETARYVSVPSTDPSCPAPHLTGGAVDLTLADGDGRPLDMGTAFDAFVPQAGALALEPHRGPARDHRRLLFWAMAAQGFTAYVEEWWHYDFGDQFWGSVRGCPAVYGPTEPVT